MGLAEQDIRLVPRVASRRAPAIPVLEPPDRRSGLELAWAVLVVMAVAGTLGVLTVWAFTQLPPAMKVRSPTPYAPSPGMRWLEAFSWWDGAWYVDIAERGYRWTPGRQSPVAFFPAYPLVVRAVAVVTRNAVLAGVLATLACGVAASVVFFRWCRERLGRPQAWTALAVLLAYPCSFYLFGKVYADALVVLMAVSAFLFLERDRPVWAGLAGGVATATRPTALAVVVGLWAVSAHRRRGLPHPALLLAPLGALAYAGYLWARFNEPLAFIKVEGAPGWNQAPGWNTWLKVSWWRRISQPPFLNPPHYHLALHALITLIALVMVVFVFKRLGWGYGIYTLALVAGCALSTKDFVGMGRYVLAAFPLFAVAGDMLWRRPKVRAGVLIGSAGLLVLFTQLQARNMLIS